MRIAISVRILTMPPLPVVPNVMRSDIQWKIGGDTAASTKLTWKYSGGPPNSTDCLAYASTIWSNVSSIMGLCVSTVSLEGVKVIDLSSVAGGVGIHEEVAVGSRTGDEGPGSLCVLVNYQITRRYRGGKPRSYWPFGVAQDLSTQQTWDSTLLNAISTSLAGFFSAIIGQTQGTTTIEDHVNVSYYEGFHVVTTPSGRMKNVSNPRTVPVVDTIVSFAAAPRPGSQRRRN